MSPQARGSAGGRRRHDPASQEDHDKPYVCDSKYRQCRIPSPGPAPSPTFPCAPLTVTLSLWPAGSSSGACVPSSHACASPPSPPPLAPVWPRCFCLRESKPQGLTLDAVLLSLSVSLFAVVLQLSLFHSCLLKICPLFFFSISESYKQKHNSKSSNKGTWLLWLSFVSL